MNLLAHAARLYPWAVDVDEDLQRAVRFLGLSTPPQQLLRASYGVGIAGGAVALVVAVISPPDLRAVLTLLTAGFAFLCSYAVVAIPRLIATARRVHALGDAPDLVGRAVLSMRLSPSTERAAVFAAEAGSSPLGASLGRHVRIARTANRSAFESFGEEWEPWFPALGRSLSLVSTASSMSTADRERTLDRALTVVIDGTREQLRSFAERIRRPLTALYAFGVLLPTALVALLPAAHAAGVGITPLTIVLVYDLLLPAVLVTAAAWLLVRRPVTFPPPNVGRHHPDVPDRRLLAVGSGGISVVVSWMVSGWLFPPWAPPVAAVGIGVGTALFVLYRPVVGVYDRIRDIESGLTDALSLVGHRVSNGRAVETAIQDVESELTGEIATVFASAGTVQRQLQVGVERAFLGEYGVLAQVSSSRVRGSISFLTLAARDGRPAGSAILALADHLDDLRRVEEEMRHTLQTVCGTLRSTGTLFGPLVAGVTVALADGMASGGAGIPGAGQGLPWLGFAVGWYVLSLAAILPALATGLVSGLDRALVAVRVGRSLVVATVVYLLAYAIAAGVA